MKMTPARIFASGRSVFAAGLATALCLAAACSPSRQQAPVDSGGQPQDTGLQPSPDTAPAAEDTAPPPTADTAPPAPDVGSRDVVVPIPEVAADTSPPDAGNKPPAAPSAGCSSADQLPEGAGTLPGGRRYMVHLPTGYEKTRPYPLVFANHPNGGNIGMFEDQKTKTVIKEWAILVLTQSETGVWTASFPADLAYFDALVPLLKEKLCVDTGRIYAFGFSGGASFSNLLACTRTFLRAVGGGGGIPGYNGYTAADCKPMPAWIDQGMRAGLVELWTAKDGCTQKLPGNRPNCSTYMCTTAPVVYCTNGAHIWPSYGSEDVSAFFRQF